MRFVFFGAYNPAYPRNAVLRRGLKLGGAEVGECRAPAKFKAWARYPLLLFSWGRIRDGHGMVPGRFPGFIFVPEFCQKDVPLAKLLSLLTSKRLIFDPLASRYETKIMDWKRKPADSPSAWWNLKIDGLAFRLADLILADTAAHKEYYCRKYGVKPGKVEVLPLGYDDELFKAGNVPGGLSGLSAKHPPMVPGTVAGEFRVLFFGSFLPLHGADIIIEAANIVAGQDPSVRFRLVGSGQTLPEIKAAASGLQNVDFSGWLPQDELPRAIEAADICLGIFGRTEKAQRVVPHKIFQSMGMRKPVISARTPAVEEFFHHREHMILCDEPLPRTLAAGILELKKNPDLRRRIAANGYQRVKENHSPLAVAVRLIEILRTRFP
ncbi:MAG: glycosyltransferase [Candidatus Aminicenantes bacterium]|nr:glycosyltransferase [Candidatus Aminicenantes bacterium]